MSMDKRPDNGYSIKEQPRREEIAFLKKSEVRVDVT